MREIKFRAWDGERMKEVLTLGLHEGFISTPKTVAPIEEFKLMQFTGIFDKNGKEIWEGDVVEGTGEVFKNYAKSGPSEVFYGHGQWQPFAYVGVFDGTQFEVTGNIYENADLLKEHE